ncbi:MAG: polymer-forming cytoskeletal protein [Patescibacteria group bacterium]
MFSTPKRNDSPYMPGPDTSSSSMPDANSTIIARGVKVEGEFTSQGNVVIDGEVHGHVKTTGLLTVGSEAKLKADVTAEAAVVAGSVEGNLTVKNRLELKSSAKITGDIACETAVIEAGAIVNGKVAIGATPKDMAAKSSAPVKAATAGAAA